MEDHPLEQELEQETAKKLEFLEEAFLALKEEGFTGYIKIEFRRGKIEKIEKYEEILKVKPKPEAHTQKRKP